MIDMHLDNIDRKLLSLVQLEFPLTREPYADLGQRLDINENQVLKHIERLKAKGIIRQIGPVFDARSLGYLTTLVAVRVPESKLDKAEQVIIEHPGVSHGYQRDHYFNIWFTLAIPNTADIEIEIKKLTNSIEAEAIFTLPAKKVFKIGAYFDVDGDNQPTESTPVQSSNTLYQKVELSQRDKSIINALQQNLPPTPTPFTDISAQLSIEVEDFLAQCRSLQQRGIMRRFGASVNHRLAGFKANAMACWLASPDKVDILGQKLASLQEVSHCYERKTNSLWPYNLFAMIHSQRKEVCQEIASKVSRETGTADYVLLFSTKEFKKTRVKYLV